MTDKNGVGVTVVGHDGEERTLVKGYEGRGAYVRYIHYTGTNLTRNGQLFGLLDISTSSTNVITLSSCIWVTQMDGGSHVTTLKWHTGEGPLLQIPTSAHAGWTTHVQTAAVDVTAIRMMQCGVRTAVSLLKSLTFQFYSWDLEIQAIQEKEVTTRLGNSSATEIITVLQSVLNAFVLAQNAPVELWRYQKKFIREN